MSASTQDAHFGARAMQVRRPWKISRCETRVHLSCGKPSALLDLTGSVSFVRASLTPQCADVGVHDDADV